MQSGWVDNTKIKIDKNNTQRLSTTINNFARCGKNIFSKDFIISIPTQKCDIK